MASKRSRKRNSDDMDDGYEDGASEPRAKDDGLTPISNYPKTGARSSSLATELYMNCANHLTAVNVATRQTRGAPGFPSPAVRDPAR